MHISGEYSFKRDRTSVWNALQDPKVIAKCMRGCEKLVAVSPDRYLAEMAVGIAAIQGRYSGTIEITEKNPTTSYRLTVGARGGPGNIDATGVVSLSDEGTGTRVNVEGEVQASGPLARVASRLMGAAAKTLIADFMRCVDGRGRAK